MSEETSFLQLREANVFSALGTLESITFQAAVTPKLLRFSVMNEEGERALYLASVISREEKAMWQSFQDLLGYSVKLAAAGLEGIFGLDVLTADIQKGSLNFNAQDASTLLINHGKKLAFGKRGLIRYGQIFCLLHKRAPADFGKIEVMTHIEIVSPEKTRLASFMKRNLAVGGKETNAIYLVHDLGLLPAWNLEKEAEDPKLSGFLKENPSSQYFYKSCAGLKAL